MNTEITKFSPPPEIESFFMKPPLLIGESRLVYERMFTAVANTIRPQNTIEWMLAGDFMNLSWENRRLGKTKVGLINLNWKDAIRMIVEALLDSDQEERSRVSQELADGWFTGEEAKETIKALLAKHQLTEDAIAAQAMSLRLPELDIIDRKMERTLVSRMAIMRDIEHHRIAGSWKMPKDLLPIIDAAAEPTALVPAADHTRCTP
jgi:hypothetical protein